MENFNRIMMEVDMSNEEYVIQRARSSLKNNPLAAKAWMITAKTLYPNNFGVQFEAYCIEKNSGNVKEAARCFSCLISTFQNHPELWKEIENVTSALKADNNDADDGEKQFLCDMFKHISPDVQQKLLLCTADYCEDTMEHCRLLLLLFQRFPIAIPNYGPRLVDTLISAEKHSHDGNYPLNQYRKLLISELLPLFSSSEIKVELNQKVLIKLMHKAIEFYTCYLGLTNIIMIENELKIDNIWQKLFSIIEFLGQQLDWDPMLINLTTNWSKESYWQKIVNYCQNSNSNSDDKQLIMCSSLFFFHCLHEYVISLSTESVPGQSPISYILIEAFIDPNIPNSINDSKNKRRKTDDNYPYISVEKPELKAMSINFLMACNCWELINSSELFQREFYLFNNYLKVDTLLSNFVIDYAIYKGKYDDALIHLRDISDERLLLNKNVRSVTITYMKKEYITCFNLILITLSLFPNLHNVGVLSNNLISGGNQRHLHFLPLTQTAILQYFVKILLRCIQENSLNHPYSELSIGHILTLTQLDWPQEEEFVPPIMEKIQHHGSFNYALFQNYIINVDILEEIIYLWTNQGGQITLDIIPHMGQRRIGTRGADKGAKEEIKQIIKRQVARSNENINELMMRFLTNERVSILQTLE